MKSLPILLLSLLIGAVANAQEENQEPEQAEQSLREPLPERSDPIAAKLIETSLKATGGRDRLEAINTIQFDSNVRQGKAEFDMEVSIKRPNKARLETIVNKLGREYRVIEGTNGKDAWVYDLTKDKPFPKDLTGSDKRALTKMATIDSPLLNWEANGCIVEYMGPVNNRKQKNYLVKLYHPDGLTEFFYFHPDNYLLTRQGTREKREGVIVDVDSHYVKYDKIDGIWTPTKIEMGIENQTYGVIKISNFRYNDPISDELFEMPKVKEVWLRGQ